MKHDTVRFSTKRIDSVALEAVRFVLRIRLGLLSSRFDDVKGTTIVEHTETGLSVRYEVRP